jgi:tetratricopeptide (TPR) repeat protein
MTSDKKVNKLISCNYIKVSKNKFKNIACIFKYAVFYLLLSPVLFAGDGHTQQVRNNNPEYIFYKGNTLYEEGKYDEAIGEFLKLLEQGMESGNLYYNIGNSYFKKGELGRAILNYERARRLIPRDSDLKSNYGFARSQMEYNASEESAPWFNRVLHIFDMLSINEMTVLLSALFTVVVIFLIIRLILPATRKHSVIFLSVSIIFVLFISVSLFNRITLLDKEAVVITESPEAGFEPIENSTVHFTLYEGIKIHILQSKKKWVKVKRPDGKVGWVMGRDVGKI